MDVKELEAYLKENSSNEEVKKVIKSTITFDDLIKDENLGKSIISYRDSEISKAVESFKNQTLPKRVEEELAKRVKASEEPEWKREMDALKSELAKKERENKIANQKARAIKYASEKQLPTDVIDSFLGETDEETDTKLTTFSKMFEDYSTKIKQEVLKSHNISVPNNGNQFAKEKTKEIKLPGNASKEDYKAVLSAQLAAEREQNE